MQSLIPLSINLRVIFISPVALSGSACLAGLVGLNGASRALMVVVDYAPWWRGCQSVVVVSVWPFTFGEVKNQFSV